MTSPSSTLQDSSQIKRYATLFLLYFIQGAPYGFQTSCLPLILRKKGLSYSKLGILKLLFIPWTCKPFYAPIVERTKSHLWWLIVSLMVLGLTSLAAGLNPATEDSLSFLSLVLFILNLAAATQDIAVDSVAIKILSTTELGAGNTIQVVGYKLGGVLVGGSLLWLREELGNFAMWFIFSALYFLSVILILSMGLVNLGAERADGDNVKQDRDHQTKGLQSFIRIIGENLTEIFKVNGTLWLVGFLLFYKLCERGESLFPIYLVDKNIPLKEIHHEYGIETCLNRMAVWNGMVRSVASISGSVIGGYLMSGHRYRWSARRVLTTFSFTRILPMAGQLGIIYLWGHEPIQPDDLDHPTKAAVCFYLSVFSLCVANFCAGALTTGAFTCMMNLSQSAPSSVQSTHYSLLATTEVLGKLSFATVSGYLVDTVGLDNMYVCFNILAVLTLPILRAMPNLEVVKSS